MHSAKILSLLATAVLAAPSTSHANETSSGLTWFDGSLPQAVAQARDRDQLVVVYFWRNGSEYCAKLYQETLQDERSVDALQDFVLVSANHGDAMGASLMEQFNVRTLPFLLFVGADGRPEDSIAGFLPSEELVWQLDRIERGEGTRSDLERRVAAAEPGSVDDFELRFALAGKVQELGDQALHDEIIATVCDEDPERKTVYGARAFLWTIQGEVFTAAAEAAGYPGGAQGDPEKQRAISAKVDLKPLYAHAGAVKLDESRFEAWVAIVTAEVGRESYDDAFKALGKAWKVVPEDQMLGFALNATQEVMGMPVEPGSKEKKFVMELADRALELARTTPLDGDDGGDGAMEEGAHERYVASLLARVAGAYRYCGKEKKAEALLADCIDLDPDGEYEAMLAAWREEA